MLFKINFAKIYLLIFCLFAFSNFVFGKENISFQFGMQYLSKNNYPIFQGEYEVSTVGMTFGILIPIKILDFDSYYKVRIGIHRVNKFVYNSSWYQNNYPELENYNDFLTGINEILIGKSMQIKESELLPQIGFGFIGEEIGRASGGGIVWRLFFLDLSMIFRPNMFNQRFGIMANYERGFWESFENMPAKNRLNFSLIVQL